jgi:hypothetical protein
MNKRIIITLIAMIFTSEGILLDTQNQVKYCCYMNSDNTAYMRTHKINDFWGSSSYLGRFKNYQKCVDKLKEMSK